MSAVSTQSKVMHFYTSRANGVHVLVSTGNACNDVGPKPRAYGGNVKVVMIFLCRVSVG